MPRDGGHIEQTGQFSASDIITQMEVNPSFSSTGYRHTVALDTTGSNPTSTLTINDDKVFIYSNSGTYTFQVATGITAEVLVVGGGGAGGSSKWNEGAGGGGAGGYIFHTNMSITAGSHTVTVGAGGAIKQQGAENFGGGNGGNSSFNGMTGYGGGGGGPNNGYGGFNGGSGGGGIGVNRWKPGGSATQTDHAGGDGMGHNGAGGQWYKDGGHGYGGGGGGAGSAGTEAASNANGGQGTWNDITGTNTQYAAGGGGGASIHQSGSQPGSSPSLAGSGGGGGHALERSVAYPGQAGIVIIRFHATTDAGDLDSVSMRSLHVDHWNWARGVNQTDPGTTAPHTNGAANKFRKSDVFGVKVKVRNESTTPYGGAGQDHYGQVDDGAIHLEMLGGSGGPGWKVGVINHTGEDDAKVHGELGNPAHTFNMSSYNWATLTNTQNKIIINELGSLERDTTNGTTVTVKIYDAAAVDDSTAFFITMQIYIAYNTGTPTVKFDVGGDQTSAYSFNNPSPTTWSKYIEAWHAGENNTWDRIVVES